MPDGEATVATWVQEHLATQADLRTALDTILDRLEAIPQAQTALDEMHRTWFVQTLRQELATMGTRHVLRLTSRARGALPRDQEQSRLASVG
jgi:hypothetical protein